MERLSPRQEDILNFILSVVDQRGVHPSYREIGAALSISSTNAVSDHIKALIRKGYLERVGQAGRPRSLRLTERATGMHQQGAVVGVPLIGRVAAGSPILAHESYEETLHVDAGMLPAGGKVFALVITGESMIEDGMNDGDTLFVRQTQTVRNGEIAVVRVEGEATVKRIYREDGRLRLQPSNSAMEPIWVDESADEVEIVGEAVALYRRIR